MRLPDSWSFRQRPTGAFKRVLHLPVHLFHWRMGFLLGERFLLLSHRGRRSGRVFETPVEIVQHDSATHEYLVCSGTGPAADWYRNLRAGPPVSIQVRNARWVPVVRFPDAEEAARRFADYEAAHPGTARRLLSSMGNSYDGTDADRVRMMADMPMVAFSDSGTPPADEAPEHGRERTQP